MGVQSLRFQNVGTIIIFAPPAISSRNASGKARSQHISIPTLPRGVSKATCGSCRDEVRCGRSGCQRFFFWYWERILPSLEMKDATFSSAESCFSTMVPGTMQMFSSAARAEYASRYFWYWLQREANLGSSGSQFVRWYSGRTARWHPWEAASRMNDTAFS